MSYLPETHRCAWCGVDLEPDGGDGTCATCDDKTVECAECGSDRISDQPCMVCNPKLKGSNTRGGLRTYWTNVLKRVEEGDAFTTPELGEMIQRAKGWGT